MLRESRVRKIFDFTNIREIVSSETDDVDAATSSQDWLIQPGLKEEVINEHLRNIADDFEKERPINWDTVEQLITVNTSGKTRKELPQLASSHGTHVAGIIGADPTGNAKKDSKTSGGMCPDIGLYDFRVLGKESGRHRVRGDRSSAVHPLRERAAQFHHDPRRQSQPVDFAQRSQFRLWTHTCLQRMRKTGGKRRRGGGGGR